MQIRQVLGRATCVIVFAFSSIPIFGEAPPLPGQSPSPLQPTQPLTLREALVLAEENNPQLRVAAAQREGAVAAITTARAYPNPTVAFLAGPQYSRMSNAGRGPSGVLQAYTFTQPIELPSLRKARIEAARKAQDSSEYGIESARLAVRGAVKQAFYQVLRHRREVEVADENLKLIEDLRQRIETQVEVGEAARLELVRAEAEVATARTLLRSAQLRQVTALSVLRATIGLSAGPPLDPRGELARPIPLPPPQAMRAEMNERHPILNQARAEITVAEARLKTEIAARKPQPSVYTDYEHQPDLGFARIGVNIPLPIWNKREGPIAESVAAVNRTRAERHVRELELAAALERALGLYEVATQQIQSFEEGVLKEAEAALAAAEAAFRYGERGIIEVLDAQRVLRSVRLDFLNAQFDLQAALIDLEQLRALDLGANP
ncbi:MAG: TolC family protein [Bryobacteraceae bacterium]|nr:TolC family protein [Solibacteraceae bacterium]MCL4842216.1 TolC family protein [Bryobacteraceae bacterium]